MLIKARAISQFIYLHQNLLSVITFVIMLKPLLIFSQTITAQAHCFYVILDATFLSSRLHFAYFVTYTQITGARY
jgi:hypothetical protein